MKTAPGTVSGAEPVTLGHVLATGREACGLTLVGVASTLRLEPHFVVALEEDRLELFVAPVFVKGYLRQLAGLYGMRYEELLALYFREANVADVRPQSAPPVGRRRRVRWRLVFGGLILLAGTAAYLFARMGGNSIVGFPDWSWEALIPVVEPAGNDATEPAAGPETGELSEAGLPVTGMVAAGQQTELGDTGRAQAPVADETGSTVVADRPGAAVTESERFVVPGSGESTPAVSGPLPDADSADVTVPAETVQMLEPTVRVDMVFREDSWVEVTDGNGQWLYYDLGRAGTVASFDGAPPVSFMLGYPAGVRVSIDGQPYPVPASDGDSRTVRFVVGE